MAKTQTKTSAADFIPDDPTLARLQVASQDCRGCDLWECGTQTVFGEGRRQAEVVLVGEQPGDKEDIEGRPFVGPAGKILDKGRAGGLRPRSTRDCNGSPLFHPPSSE